MPDLGTLRELTREFRPPPFDDLVGVSRTRRRRSAMATAVAAAAAVVVVTTVATVVDDQRATDPPPAAPSPSVTDDSVRRNGQVTSAERYLGEDPDPWAWRDFDAVSESGLHVIRRAFDEPMEGLAVVGRTGPIATLTCGSDLACSPTGSSFAEVATLGPGADEVTVRSGDRTAQVIGYDGTVRRTLDLTATVTDDEDVRGLRWSPDGSRLAVLVQGHHDLTGLSGCHVWSCGGTGSTSRVWLVDREGGNAQLAYSLLDVKESAATFDAARQLAQLLPSEFDGCCTIWFPGQGWSWSPDGRALLLDVLTGRNRHTTGLVVLHLPPSGVAGPVRAQTLLSSFRSWDNVGNVAWSPDGTRIAVKTTGGDGHDGHGTLEISAEDGSILAEHHNPGWLIWPAEQG